LKVNLHYNIRPPEIIVEPDLNVLYIASH
jgi:hypothetical protein